MFLLAAACGVGGGVAPHSFRTLRALQHLNVNPVLGVSKFDSTVLGVVQPVLFEAVHVGRGVQS